MECILLLYIMECILLLYIIELMELSQQTSNAFHSDLLINYWSVEWMLVTDHSDGQKLFSSVSLIVKIFPVIIYFGLKGVVFCSLNPFWLFWRPNELAVPSAEPLGT